MNGFQYIGVITLAVFLLLTVAAIGTRKIGRGPGMTWIVIWILGTLALLQPNVTTTLANLVGIHRGADLLLYVVVIIMTIGFFSMYLRLRQLRREFTLLIRKISIMELDATDHKHGSE